LKRIANTELVVCSEETQASHSELFHYTKRVGFHGVVTSNTFRASHFEDMEDKREVWLLQDRLVSTLAPKFD
jgi:hypothetical protein